MHLQIPIPTSISTTRPQPTLYPQLDHRHHHLFERIRKVAIQVNPEPQNYSPIPQHLFISTNPNFRSESLQAKPKRLKYRGAPGEN